MAIGIKKTHEEFIEQIKSINSNITIIGEYVRAKDKIEYKCNVCGNIHMATPDKLLMGRGCPQCAITKRAKNKMISHDDFVSIVKESSPNIRIIGLYEGVKKRVKCECLTDGFVFMGDANRLMRGSGCPECKKRGISERSKICHNEFMRRFEMCRNVDEIKIIGKYEKSNKKIECLCLMCRDAFFSTPNNILRGKGCPKCAGNTKKTHDDFIEQVLLKNKDVDVLSEYINAKTKIKFKCKIDGHVWWTLPNGFLSGAGCPICGISKGEGEIFRVLKYNDVKTIPQMSFDGLNGLGGKPLSYDFYLKEPNLLIEYQGEYHDGNVRNQTKSQLTRQQEHDKRKREYAQQHGIQLLEIWYWDMDNIEDILTRELNLKRGDTSE